MRIQQRAGCSPRRWPWFAAPAPPPPPTETTVSIRPRSPIARLPSICSKQIVNIDSGTGDVAGGAKTGRCSPDA